MNSENKLPSPASEEIERLIRDEPYPRNRALLLILERIDDSLRENMRQTHDIGAKLDAHLTRYEEQARADASLRSQAQLVWKALAYVVTFAQAVLIAGGTLLYGEIRGLHAIDSDVIQRIGLVESAVKHMEKAHAP